MEQTKLLFRAALIVALIAVGARIQIPLPYFDYYTLQFTFVLLGAALLPPIYAFGAVAAYVVMGLLGIPVFAGGGGISYILRPSFGYLIGFALCAGALSYVHQNYAVHTKKQYFLMNLLGIVIVYFFGLTYKTAILYWYLNETVDWAVLLSTAFAFDIPTDIIMVAILSLGERRIFKALRAFSRQRKPKQMHMA